MAIDRKEIIVVKRILTIAGSDSGGGAGIQADLKTITLLGGFGMSVITALTAQNTLGVQDIYPISPKFIERQMDTVISDIGVDAAKTGMLVSSDVIRAVAKKIKDYRVAKLIVDPVLVAKGGQSLLSKDALNTLTHELIPLAFVVTPNLPEASAISGRRVETAEDMRDAARYIHEKGARNVLIKGGHLTGSSKDILFDGEGFFEYTSERIPTENTHGTGCVHSAALAFELANGSHIQQAVQNAKEFVTSAIKDSLPLGKGYGPINPYAVFAREVHRYQVISEVKEAVKALKREKVGRLIPEVQSNLGMAVPYACKVEDVAAVPSRIIRYGDTITTVSGPEFGASQHVARIILTLMRYDKEVRSVMNIKYTEDIVKRCSDMGLNVRCLDRRKEPDYISKKEGASLEWIIENAMKEEKKVPDVIYDTGNVGKEAMVRVVGRDAKEVVEKVLRIAKG